MKFQPPRDLADVLALERFAMALQFRLWGELSEDDRNRWRNEALRLLNEAGAHWRPDE